MFNINNISDKYSSLYLNDDIKDQFFSLLLIGLDNKYMDVDAETLNNTTQHYKDKLNIRFKEVFNKNFNLKSKDHLGLLSDTLGVNFTFKNLNTNKNRNTFKVYNKTLYFLNDGNEYGLVLKNNKKSLQGGLAESSLKAFEKLNLEGGNPIRRSNRIQKKNRLGPYQNPPIQNNQFNDELLFKFISFEFKILTSYILKTAQKKTQNNGIMIQNKKKINLQNNILYLLAIGTNNLKSKESVTSISVTPQPKPQLSQSPPALAMTATGQNSNVSSKYNTLINNISNTTECLENCYIDSKVNDIINNIKNNANKRTLDYINNTFKHDEKLIDFILEQNTSSQNTITINQIEIEIDEITKLVNNTDNNVIMRNKNNTENNTVMNSNNKNNTVMNSNNNNYNVMNSNNNNLKDSTINSINLKNSIINSIKEKTNLELQNYFNYSLYNNISDGNEDDDYFEEKNNNIKTRLTSVSFSSFMQSGGSLDLQNNQIGGTNQVTCQSNFNDEIIVPFIKKDIKYFLKRGVDSIHDFKDAKSDLEDDDSNSKNNLIKLFIDGDYKGNTLICLVHKVLIDKINLDYNVFHKKKQDFIVPYLNSIKIPYKLYFPRFYSRSDNEGGWEAQFSKNYSYVYTTEKQRSQNILEHLGQKNLIIFRDTQGAQDVFYNFVSNVFSNPEIIQNTIDGNMKKVIEEIGKNLKEYRNKFEPLKFKTNITNSGIQKSTFQKEFKNACVEYSKIFNFKVAANETGISGDNGDNGNDKFICTRREYFFVNPTNLIDGETKSLNKVSFKEILNKINKKINNNNDTLKLQKLQPISDIYTEVTYDDATKKFTYKEISTENGDFFEFKYQQENILDKVYDNHFKKINENINFKFLLKDSTDEKNLEAYLMLTNITLSNKKYIVKWGGFGEKGDLLKLYELFQIIQYQEFYTGKDLINGNNVHRGIIGAITTDNNKKKNYLDYKIENTEKRKNFAILIRCISDLLNDGTSSKDTIKLLKRMVITFKLIGDQGQINFIKYLKSKEDFNEHFETLFTTHDALARIYACENYISNVFLNPKGNVSVDLCKSKPNGMIYFPSNKNGFNTNLDDVDDVDDVDDEYGLSNNRDYIKNVDKYINKNIKLNTTTSTTPQQPQQQPQPAQPQQPLQQPQQAQQQPQQPQPQPQPPPQQQPQQQALQQPQQALQQPQQQAQQALSNLFSSIIPNFIKSLFSSAEEQTTSTTPDNKQAVPKKGLKFITWNIHYLIWKKPFQENIDKIIGYIEETEKPDILFIQESKIEPEKFQSYEMERKIVFDTKKKEIGCLSILYKSKFKHISTASQVFNKDKTRSLLGVHLIYENTNYFLINVHAPHHLDTDKTLLDELIGHIYTIMKDLRSNHKYLEKMKKNDTKVIISGDFNELIKDFSSSQIIINKTNNNALPSFTNSIELKLQLKIPDENTCCFEAPTLSPNSNTYIPNENVQIPYFKASLFFHSNNINIYESDVGNVKLSDHEPFIVNFN